MSEMDWFFDAINNPDKLLKGAVKVHKHIFKNGRCEICGKTIFEIMELK